MNARHLWMLAGLLASAPIAAAQEPIAPKETVKLCNGKNLDGWTSWLKDTKRDDPRKVFTAKDGAIHISGDGFGYLATKNVYRDYHLSVEYKWGKKTDGGKFVRNSGILLNAIGPDGGANGTWMSCIECQIAQGCVGDLIVIRGKDKDGKVIPTKLSAETEFGPDKRPRWESGGTVELFTNRQLWWNKHEAGFKELLDTRGKDDLDSLPGEWTKVECLCRDKTIEIRVNGKTVNKAFNVFPAAGKILLQSEGFEIDFRHVELRPLKAADDDGSYTKVEMRGKLRHYRNSDPSAGSWERREYWYLNGKNVDCTLHFDQKMDLLEFAKKNEGKTVVVKGTRTLDRNQFDPIIARIQFAVAVTSIELAKEN